MALKWAFPIQDEHFVPWNYLCRPIYWHDQLYYAFSSIEEEEINGFHFKAIYVLEIDNLGVLTSLKKIKFDSQRNPEFRIAHTRDWNFRILKNKLFLYVGFWLDLNDSKIKTTDLKVVTAKFEINSEFIFDNFVIDYNGLSSIRCVSKDTNSVLWRIKLKGYLYTIVEQKDDFIFFGTAGKGGAFYFVNWKTGKILAEFVNQDSSQFIWLKNLVLLRDKVGHLVKLNPMNGEIVYQLKLKDKLFYAPFLKNDDLIFTTVYNSKSGYVSIVCLQD